MRIKKKLLDCWAERSFLLCHLRELLLLFISASPSVPHSPSQQTVWSCRTPIFHRVIRVKEWGLRYHVHGHLVSSRFSAEAQCVPHGLPYGAKVEKQLCEDYQSPITANVSASAPLSLIMSIGKHTGRVYQTPKTKSCEDGVSSAAGQVGNKEIIKTHWPSVEVLL